MRRGDKKMVDAFVQYLQGVYGDQSDEELYADTPPPAFGVPMFMEADDLALAELDDGLQALTGGGEMPLPPMMDFDDPLAAQRIDRSVDPMEGVMMDDPLGGMGMF